MIKLWRVKQPLLTSQAKFDVKKSQKKSAAGNYKYNDNNAKKNNNENCQVSFLYNKKKTTKLEKKTFSFSGPNDYPLNVRQLKHTTQSIFITWDAIEDNEKNGKILSYKITYTLFNGKNSPRTINVTAPIVQANLTQLGSYRRYNITVLASNVHGDGPGSDSVIERTDTSSK